MDIFNFIYKNANDTFSTFKKNDLKELLKLLKEYKIYYRDSLDLKSDTTFGVELEFSIRNRDSLISILNEYNLPLEHKWAMKNEYSIKDGCEIVSPILNGCNDDWINLKNICGIVNKCNGNTNNETAAHVHFGEQILENNITNWLNFIKLYIAYENILFRFGYGEYECERWCLPNYSSPSARELEKFLRSINESNMNVWKFSKNLPLVYKESSLCIRKEMETIEFRNANGTLNPVIWQNNINFYEHFLRYASNKDFNYDIINQRRKMQDYSYNPLTSYNIINLDQALELCDLIFNNNLDKINFLRQYLKDFKTLETFKKTSSFTK